MLLDCPAYFGEDSVARGGLPAEIEYRYTIGSSDGPLESAKIRYPRGHWFNGPIEFLTWERQEGTRPAEGQARAAAHRAASNKVRERKP